jgi:selenocysteine lyase/cysteine desulfurase
MLADKIIQALSPAVLVSPPEPELRSGTVILHFADRQAALIKRLQDQHIHFDSRAKGIRLSPHLCNNSQQIDSLLDSF